jgi:hypothetical protein
LVSPRRAGHSARQITRRQSRLILGTTAALTGVLLGAFAPARWSFAGAGIIWTVVAALALIERRWVPRVERWGRGARGEEHVGDLLEELERDGWLTIHDVDTGRGNIDTIVVGPGGLFAIEVKSHGGPIRSDRIDPAMLRQAYAEKGWLERITGVPADALLVFSRAYLVGRPVSRQRGVVVLPARMLLEQLRRRDVVLPAEEVRRLHDRLSFSLSGVG